MELFSTLKALEYFKIEPRVNESNITFNHWSMHVKKINRRNTLILMHLESKYIVVMYGFKKMSKEKLDDFIRKQMTIFFEAKGIHQSVITTLLPDREFLYSKNHSRSITSQLVNRMFDVSLLLDEYVEDSVLQLSLMNEINWQESFSYGDITGDSFFRLIENNFINPYLIPRAIEISTELVLESYSVKRDFLINPKMKLIDLHHLIQIGYQYSDSYHHAFFMIDDEGELIREFSNELGDVSIEYNISLDEIISLGHRLLYVYNFESDWKILITPTITRQNVEQRLPTCLNSSAEAPHESFASEEDYDLILDLMDEYIPPVLRQVFESNVKYDQDSINLQISKEMYR